MRLGSRACVDGKDLELAGAEEQGQSTDAASFSYQIRSILNLFVKVKCWGTESGERGG